MIRCHIDPVHTDAGLGGFKHQSTVTYKLNPIVHQIRITNQIKAFEPLVGKHKCFTGHAVLCQ